MEMLLHGIAHYVAPAVEPIAIAVIAISAIEAVIGIARVVMTRAGATNNGRRGVWLNFGAGWLRVSRSSLRRTPSIRRSILPGRSSAVWVRSLRSARSSVTLSIGEVEDVRKRQHPVVK